MLVLVNCCIVFLYVFAYGCINVFVFFSPDKNVLYVFLNFCSLFFLFYSLFLPFIFIMESTLSLLVSLPFVASTFFFANLLYCFTAFFSLCFMRMPFLFICCYYYYSIKMLLLKVCFFLCKIFFSFPLLIIIESAMQLNLLILY